MPSWTSTSPNNYACVAFNTKYNSVLSSSCSSQTDCIFNYLNCVNGKCLPIDRLENDPCVDSSQCVTTSAVPLLCYNGKCTKYTLAKTIQVDGTCTVLPPSQTVNVWNVCVDGSM